MDDNQEMTNIYLVLAENGLTKIGRSNNVKNRLATIKTSNASMVALLFSFYAPAQTEWLLHNHFCEKRVRGEWFSLGQEDIKYIATIAKNGLPSYDKILELIDEASDWGVFGYNNESSKGFVAFSFRCEVLQ
jgi:hypothetical protein